MMESVTPIHGDIGRGSGAKSGKDVLTESKKACQKSTSIRGIHIVRSRYV